MRAFLRGKNEHRPTQRTGQNAWRLYQRCRNLLSPDETFPAKANNQIKFDIGYEPNELYSEILY